MAKSKKKTGSGPKQFRNKRAYYEYHVLEKIEAGIELRGTEVKAIREGNISLAESYARVDANEVFLVGCHIGEYKAGSWTNHEPRRKRKLLLHRREIQKIIVKTREKGLTLVPLRAYFNSRGYAKVELGICQGKKLHDKRQAMKERDTRREMDRAISGR